MTKQSLNHSFVSRGGIKLQAALDTFQIDITGKIVLDVGSSTGGFVDCLLQNGAKLVYSVDTAYGELAWKLRQNPGVVVIERTNILHLGCLPSVKNIPPDTNQMKKDPHKVDLITIDASWTKLELILPTVKKFLKKQGIIIALLKPHYQANKKQLIKGVVPEGIVEQIKNQVLENIQDLGFRVQQVIDSPILGGGGNKEFLVKILIPE